MASKFVTLATFHLPSPTPVNTVVDEYLNVLRISFTLLISHELKSAFITRASLNVLYMLVTLDVVHLLRPARHHGNLHQTKDTV